ncbi:GAF and ANTAR domain-containing protein [Nocardia sp. NPDC057440]|uniref:GAF and ANTAR domain-containing protein n=1 Tax=Nocardia sp. NPDC057440 TaxID=3346134 RepID=UPI0036722935
MSDSQVLVAAVSRFADAVAVVDETARMVRQLMDSATDVLDLAGCTVTLVQEGPERFTAATPDALLEVELCQHRAGRGPCEEALRHGEPITVTDIGLRRAVWPEFCAESVRQQVSAVAAVPMRSGEAKVGVLGMYAREPRDWTEQDLSVGGLLASMAAGHIIKSTVIRRQEQLTEQLTHALDTRIIVEQAKGVLANAGRTTPDAAYELIRAHARVNRVPVQAVAKAIVELGLRI